MVTTLINPKFDFEIANIYCVLQEKMLLVLLGYHNTVVKKLTYSY